MSAILIWLPGSTTPVAEAAFAYADHGYRVMPLFEVRARGVCSCALRENCAHPGKHPILANWPKYATTDRGSIFYWFHHRYRYSNIGMPMGGPKRLVALDIDGPAGRGSLAALEAQHGRLPDTLTSRSGRVDGGEHRIFVVPLVANIDAISNSAGHVAPGLDVRADGGQIVVPPSLHASGGMYQWLNRVEPAPLPFWLYDIMVARKESEPQRLTPSIRTEPVHTSSSRPKATKRERRYALGALKGAVATIASAKEGTRNNTLNREAFAVGGFIGSGALTLTATRKRLRAAAVRCGLLDSEIAATLDRALDEGAKHPRMPPDDGVGLGGRRFVHGVGGAR